MNQKLEANSPVVIEIKNLKKSFKISLRKSGFLNNIKSIFAPTTKDVVAVDNISFDVKEGELVAFIGPNGAGKSTTLKILSGILFPDSGEISVLGFNPQKDRRKLAYRIGTVFGQKGQLWFHLPSIDSFDLFSKIYEIEETEYRKRLDELVKLFEIENVINQPVRKLSLGERMKCELVLALLHNPQILFLDEPTIGLDIIAKKKMRELIKKINEEKKTTIILTSHDMDDVESICHRMIIINKGSLVYDGKISEIKKKYLTTKLIKVVSDTRIKSDIEGANIIEMSEFNAKLEVDTSKTSLKTIIDKLIKENSIVDITIEEAPIEEIIEKIYRA